MSYLRETTESCLDAFVCIWISNFPGPFVKKTVISPLIHLCSFVKDQLIISVCLFLSSLFCCIDLYVCSFINLYCLNYCSFMSWSSTLSCFINVLAILAILSFYINFRISLLIPIKLLEFLFVLCWDWVGKNQHINSIVFQFMNVLSLNLFSYSLTFYQFLIFPYIKSAHTLLYLYVFQIGQYYTWCYF